MMKHVLFISLLAAGVVSCGEATKSTPNDQQAGSLQQAANIDSADRNNNFYDNVESYPLSGGEIFVTGEIENPGIADLSSLPRHSVITKEALMNDDGSNSFVGAYRYDGYSLFDILADRILDKKNKEEFPPIIDLYVEIENDKGEKTVLSWGEIYYATILNQILIATDVSRIVPSKSKDLWPLPTERKLVVVNDLLTERNLSNPVKITVRSCDRSFPINRHLDPLWAPEIKFSDTGSTWLTLSGDPSGVTEETLHTIFYGRGRGIHSTQPFTGYPLKAVLKDHWKEGKEILRQGLVLIVSADGYRSIYTYSEIMNRNDQADILLVPVAQGEDGGLFRIFPGCDFFSDRAVKAVSDIILL
ncbi:MAG: hypothetical protein JXA23_02410 [Bacteroidales bacterium]|nr:hypothetical protein [Bacteroidales bacterium]